MGRATVEKEPSMSEVLDKLGLGDEDDAETAAERAVAQMNGGKSATVSEIEIPPPRDKEGDAAEDDAEEDETALPSAVMPAATPPLIPAPSLGKPGKKAGRNTSPAAKKLGVLSQKAPGAEKVKISKRDDRGELHFVNDYTAVDMDRFSDYESFIKRYIEPEHGAGEYELTAVNANNQEWALGTVRLIKTAKPPSPESSILGMVDKVIQQGREQNEQHIARIEKTMQQPQDPLGLLRGVMDLTEQLEQKTGGGKQDSMTVAVAAMNQSTQILTALLSKPREPDPMMPVLLELLREKKSDNTVPLAAPPPPPPPTSVFDKLDIPTTLTALAAFIGALAPLMSRKEDNSNQILTTYLLKQAESKEQFGFRDVLDLMRKERESASGGGDDLMQQIDKLAAVMNLAKNLDGGQQQQTSFMDALASLLGNRDLGAGIARLVTSKMGVAGPPSAAQQQLQQKEQQLRAAAQRIQSEGQRLEQERAAFEEEKRRLSSGEAPSAPVETTAPAVHADAPTAERAQEATEKVQAALGEVPQLPPQTKEFLDEIEKASDEATLGKSLMDLLVYLHGHPPIWRGFVENTFLAMREDNAAKTLKYLHAFFETAARLNLVSAEAATRVLKMVKANTTSFRELLADMKLDKDEQVTGADLVASPAPA